MEQKTVDAILKDVVSLSFAYIDKVSKQVAALDLKEEDKENDLKKLHFNFLHEILATLLDLSHRSFPLCYDLFPENKENLDNAYKMFKRFEAAKLLKECPCDYCKQHPYSSTDIDAIKKAVEKSEVKD